MRILLVEDDQIIAENIKYLLSKKGISIDISNTLESGYEKITNEEYDLMVLDRGMPDGEGLDLIKKIRNEDVHIPILILTAKNNDFDIIEGLNSGADDYLSKPFDMDVLLARIKALSRRIGKIPTKPILDIKDLKIDTNAIKVNRKGLDIKLSPREYSILEYLAIHKNQVVDRLTLLTHAWDENIDSFSNTVDVHIKYLRNKIDKGFKNKLIKTIRGRGYMISDK